MPGVHADPAIGAVGPAHDLPGRGRVGDLRPGQELQVHDEAMLGGPVAQLGEGLGRVVEAPVPAEDVDGVEGAGADGVGKTKHVVLAEPEHAHRVGLGRDRHVGTGQPPPGHIELGHDQAVGGEEGAQVGVAQALVAAGLLVVARPQGNAGEATSGRRRQALGEGHAGGQGARAQHEIIGAERHRQYPASRSTRPSRPSPARQRRRLSAKRSKVRAMVSGALHEMWGLRRTLGCE